jgi:hypothetical protein
MIWKIVVSRWISPCFTIGVIFIGNLLRDFSCQFSCLELQIPVRLKCEW